VGQKEKDHSGAVSRIIRPSFRKQVNQPKTPISLAEGDRQIDRLIAKKKQVRFARRF